MRKLDWLIKADYTWRRTRFHDLKGNRVDLRSALDAPKVIVESLLRAWFGFRPVLPWIPYPAIRHIESLLRRSWNVLEFGSGMSTIWLARRCGLVHSIETEPYWYREVAAMIQQRRLTNVRLEFRDAHLDASAYADLSAYEDQYFDFCVVDGLFRDQAVRTALKKIKRGGYLFLDNTDYAVMGGDYRKAEDLLLTAASQMSGQVAYYTGFAPAQFKANQSVLARL